MTCALLTIALLLYLLTVAFIVRFFWAASPRRETRQDAPSDGRAWDGG